MEELPPSARSSSNPLAMVALQLSCSTSRLGQYVGHPVSRSSTETHAYLQIVEIISIIGSAWFAKKYQRKGLVIAALSIIPSIGAILMLTIPRRLKGVLLLGYYLVSSCTLFT